MKNGWCQKCFCSSDRWKHANSNIQAYLGINTRTEKSMLKLSGEKNPKTKWPVVMSDTGGSSQDAGLAVSSLCFSWTQRRSDSDDWIIWHHVGGSPLQQLWTSLTWEDKTRQDLVCYDTTPTRSKTKTVLTLLKPVQSSLRGLSEFIHSPSSLC